VVIGIPTAPAVVGAEGTETVVSAAATVEFTTGASAPTTLADAVPTAAETGAGPVTAGVVSGTCVALALDNPEVPGPCDGFASVKLPIAVGLADAEEFS